MNFTKPLTQIFKCPIHQGQPSNIICINFQCTQVGLICGYCQQQHKDHKIISSKLFFKTLTDSITYEQSSDNLLLHPLRIDLLFIEIQDLFKKLQVDYKKNLIKVLNEYKSSIKEQIFQIHQIIKNFQQLFMGQITFQAFNFLFTKNLKKLYALDQQQSNQNFVQKSFFRIYKKILKAKQDIQTAISKNNYTYQYLVALMPIKIQQYSKVRFYFSQVNKGQGMKINGLYEATMATSSSQRLMLLEPSLEKNTAIKTWKIKIIKLASWIGVGMAHLNLIKNGNFNFNYTNTGHGNYLISSNGYSWSSLKPEFNSKFEPFTFTTGDTIQLEYNPKKKVINFSKLTTDQTYSLQFDFLPNDPLYPAVNLTGVGDCVEILN